MQFWNDALDFDNIHFLKNKLSFMEIFQKTKWCNFMKGISFNVYSNVSLNNITVVIEHISRKTSLQKQMGKLLVMKTMNEIKVLKQFLERTGVNHLVICDSFVLVGEVIWIYTKRR